MTVRYEYKTVELPVKAGLFKQGTPDIDKTLNAEGAAGWRLRQVLMAGTALVGDADKLLAILERPRD